MPDSTYYRLVSWELVDGYLNLGWTFARSHAGLHRINYGFPMVWSPCACGRKMKEPQNGR